KPWCPCGRTSICGEEQIVVSVPRRAEDGIKIVWQQQEARIDEAAIQIKIVVYPVGQGGLGVVHQEEHREMTKPFLNVRIASHALHIGVARSGVRVDCKEQVD